MRDMLENIVVLDAIRAMAKAVGDEDVRNNGVHAVAGEIDLADYNYPRKILVAVSVGDIGTDGTLNAIMEHGDATTVLTTDTGFVFVAIDAVGNALYEYTPTKRFLNFKATVAVTASAVTFCVNFIMEHSRYGSQSGLLT